MSSMSARAKSFDMTACREVTFTFNENQHLHRRASMIGSSALLQHAHERAAALRDRYTAAGLWSAQPVDVVRTTAAQHPDRLALITRRGEISYADLDGRVERVARKMLGAGVEASMPLVVVVGND